MKDPLGKILVKKGFITKEDLDKAIELQKESGGLVGIILMNTKKITADQLSEALLFQNEGDSNDN
jgi:type IV pilus assembly protein PilB